MNDCKDKSKDTFLNIRISSDEKGRWFLYANSVGYDSLSEFIRDSINGLITEAKKPEKKIVIVN